MSTITYKCPCCGAPLEYSGDSGTLKCASCSNEYDLDAITALENNEEGSVEFSMPVDGYSDTEAQSMHAYICQNCGAELVTDGNTTATECAYCGSPAILPDQIRGGIRPERVVPFKITKEQAVQQFQEYFHGKRLMPNIFLNSSNRISEIRRLYVPYWLFDCDAKGTMIFDAEKVKVTREGEFEVKRTDHFVVQRSGRMSFDSIPVDASQKLDNAIAESLEPYDYSTAVEFRPEVLSGALADNADADADACADRAIHRVESSMETALEGTVHGYSSVHVHSRAIRAEQAKATPVLLPVWIITTEKQEKDGKHTYTFAINGQTGKLTCNVRPAAGKSAAWFWGLFAGITAAGYAALVLLRALGVF